MLGGENENGALGAGAFPSGCGLTCERPVAVEGITDAMDFVVGANHACALRAGGKVSCWGAGHRGQLGIKNVPEMCKTRSGIDHRCSRKPVEVTGIADAVSIAVARDICARVAYAGTSLATAATTVVEQELVRVDAKGGVIALDRDGRYALPFNTPGMYRGWIGDDGVPHVAIFK